jgi:microcystin-dependent protein
MSEPYLSEIRIFAFAFPPKGWAFCNGQTMQIAQNPALFSLLGTTYGGDGVRTFLLPNLQGRVPMDMSGNFVLGQTGGETNHTLIASEMPQHTHAAVAGSGPANQGTSANNVWANGNQPAYAANANTQMSVSSVGFFGGSQAHNNLSPFLTLNFCIALVGIFPSRN